MSEERDALHERILEAAERYRLFEDADSVLVGVSGGQDSVALVHALVALKPVARIAVSHLHHGLRGAEADEDQRCVQALCEELGVRCHVKRRDVAAEADESGLNIEQAGRRARYEEYRRIADEHGFDRIATGHTATDRAETLLLNLFRGAGLRGLRSIPPRRGRVIRPLIDATREETGAYCRRHGLVVRTDRSNLDPGYARRNVVRLRLMPMIEEHFPGAERALMRVCEAAEEELGWTRPLLRGWLDEATIERVEQRLALDVQRLREVRAGALHRLLRMALEGVRGDLQDILREHIERVAALIEGQRTGDTVELPGQVRARREYERLVIEPDHERPEPGPEEVELPVPGRARLDERRVSVSAERGRAPASMAADDPLTAWIDAEAADAGLLLRSHRPGERFVPLGMTGSRKLQDFFVDEKVPRHRRARVPVVATGAGQILWVVGHRVAEPARATAGREAVRLTAVFD